MIIEQGVDDYRSFAIENVDLLSSHATVSGDSFVTRVLIRLHLTQIANDSLKNSTKRESEFRTIAERISLKQL